MACNVFIFCMLELPIFAESAISILASFSQLDGADEEDEDDSMADDDLDGGLNFDFALFLTLRGDLLYSDLSEVSVIIESSELSFFAFATFCRPLKRIILFQMCCCILPKMVDSMLSTSSPTWISELSIALLI